MGTVRLDPVGAVAHWPRVAGSTDVVGSAPQWSDGSDATYAAPVSGSGFGMAGVADLPATVVPGKISQHEVFIRYELTGTPAAAAKFATSVTIPSLDDYNLGRATLPASAVPAGTGWVSTSYTDDDPVVSETARAAIQSGDARVIVETVDGEFPVRVLEVYVVLTYGDGSDECRKYSVEWVDYHLEDGTGDPESLNDTDPAGSVVLPPAATLDINFGGDLTGAEVAGFDLEIEVEGTGRLRWWLEFDDPDRADYILFDHIVDLTGPTTIQVRLAADLAEHVDDYLVGAPWADVVDAMVERIADDDGAFSTAAFGQLIAHPLNTGDLTITRAQLIAFTVGCLQRRRRPVIRGRQRRDGLASHTAPRGRQNGSLRGRQIAP